jgi:hypothetical protein
MHNDLLRLQRVRGDSIYEIIFVSRLQNIEELTRSLHDVSDIDRPTREQHLTQETTLCIQKSAFYHVYVPLDHQ